MLNDICYYIDKDRYTDGVKCTNTNIIIQFETHTRRT